MILEIGGESLFYQNKSNIPKTFYGVTFGPGEIKEVSGYINHSKFIQVQKPVNTQKRLKTSESSETHEVTNTDHTNIVKSNKSNEQTSAHKS